MAKTKRLYILATCFLSGAAAILSFVALGTQEWVTSPAKLTDDSSAQDSTVKIGLFGGVFKQMYPIQAAFELTTVCAFDLNICAVLCGDNMEDYLRNYSNPDYQNADIPYCPSTTIETSNINIEKSLRDNEATDRIFINSGVWICTIMFLIISGVFGLFSAGLAVWNTATSPYQVYFSIFGLYIYNAIAFFSILLAIVLWGAMFTQDLVENIPIYQTLTNNFTTNGYASLGYSYWINLASLFLYILSICLLYVRNYLISKEPQVNVQIEDSADPVIYLY